MDSVSSSSLHENNHLDYFPSAVPESLSSVGASKIVSESSLTFPHGGGLSGKTESKENVAVILTVGPSREPVPLMRYEFHKSSNAGRSTIDGETSHDLIIKSKLIQTKFSNLVLDICSLLQDSPSTYIGKLQMWLSFQSCSKSVQSLQAFDNESDAFKVKAIPDFISSLRCYTSWYNYSLIADIAKHFCPNKGTVLVRAYETELKDYLQKLILHCPPVFPNHEEGFQTQSELLEMKVGGWEASTAVLEDLALFKHTLCQLCDLDPRFLVLREINVTSFKMTWAVPKSARGMLENVVRLKSDTLHHENNVQTIKMGDLEIDLTEVSSLLSIASWEGRD